ncbi:MAG: choice-of-anchor Q domain-containing protein, partial [Endomicrobiales bacterium]
GTYPGTYGASGANFNFGPEAPQGGRNNEVAYVGFPGETATFSGFRNFVFGYSKSYYVIAGLNLSASGKTVGLDGDHLRIVNNRCEGLKVQDYANIHPVIGGYFQIYGNEIFGATSADKHDHPVYVDNGTDNVDIGWNYFHDNNVAQGPVISVNTDYAVTRHFRFDNIRIHDNLMDCSGARGIGIVATDYGSTVYIYNNVMTNVSGSAVYQYSASSWLYNNLFYNVSGGPVISLTTVLDAGNDYRPGTVEIKNNIFCGSAPYFSISNESAMTSVTLANNAYSGEGSGPSRDSSALNADPLFANASAGDFHLLSNSPCIDRGADILATVKTDKDGVARPQGRAMDTGPYEYYTGGTTADTGTGTGSGTGTGTGTGADTGTSPGTGEQPGQDPAAAGDGSADEGTPPVQNAGPAVRAGEIQVVGSKDGRGTVNPDKGEKASINFKGSASGRFECRICTLSGEQVWRSEQDGVDSGVFDWSPKNMASGVYIAHVKGPGLSAKKRIVVLR